MVVKIFSQHGLLVQDSIHPKLDRFLREHPHASYFQSPQVFQLLYGLSEFRPTLFVSVGEQGDVLGSLLGYYQTFGTRIRGWMSRRFVVVGGPLVAAGPLELQTASTLLSQLKNHARKRAIYVEVRNLFDTRNVRRAFEQHGFCYAPHLNYLVKLDDEKEVMRRLSSSRRRQLKKTIASGATISEAADAAEVMTFYRLLSHLYRDKVRKPLASPELFLRFWRMQAGKILLVKYDGQIVAGIVCPVFNDTIYEWYICGRDGEVNNVYPSVLATWAAIEFGLQNGLGVFDFLGAGTPGEAYGVRDFKARFGGEEVCFGRYTHIVNRPLFEIGKVALRVYQRFFRPAKPPTNSI